MQKLQAGHFVAGRSNAVLFDERGVNSQCYGCNVREHGNTTTYWVWMEEKYGREVIDELISQKNTTVKFRYFELDDIAEKYKEKTRQLI